MYKWYSIAVIYYLQSRKGLKRTKQNKERRSERTRSEQNREWKSKKHGKNPVSVKVQCHASSLVLGLH